MAAKKTYKLDLASVLQAIDRRDLSFYSGLSDEEKKAYAPLVLMRYMSSLTDQNRNSPYAILATNDLVNIGFWNLSKHPELQHMLLCLAGLGGKQYRPWLPIKRSRKTNKIDSWLFERMPNLNEDELLIFKSNFGIKEWTDFVKSTGASDAEVKELVDAWKKKEA